MTAGRRLRFARSGFSLIEALVVLAVGGMALAIIFSIGMHASKSGFAIGRNAMSAADADITAGEIRTLLRSFIVRPRVSLRPEIDQPLIGDAARLSGEVVTERATRCAPAGWSGRLTLAVSRMSGGGQELTCEVDGETTRLLTMPEGGASFAFSSDGLTWSPTYSGAAAPVAADDEGLLRLTRVWIRLDTPDGGILDFSSSGEPLFWGQADGP